MQSLLNLSPILTAILMLLTVSCSNSKEDKTTIQEITLQEVVQEEKKIEPPPPPPPQSPMQDNGVQEKCFINEGLKYKTIITLFVGDTSLVFGHVTAIELGTEEKKTSEFTGRLISNKLTVNFKDTPPNIGAASEWTGTPWLIKKTVRKEILQIQFNVKNYQSNKWENMNYEFVMIDCEK